MNYKLLLKVGTQVESISQGKYMLVLLIRVSQVHLTIFMDRRSSHKKWSSARMSTTPLLSANHSNRTFPSLASCIRNLPIRLVKISMPSILITASGRSPHLAGECPDWDQTDIFVLSSATSTQRLLHVGLVARRMCFRPAAALPYAAWKLAGSFVAVT